GREASSNPGDAGAGSFPEPSQPPTETLDRSEENLVPLRASARRARDPPRPPPTSHALSTPRASGPGSGAGSGSRRNVKGSSAAARRDGSSSRSIGGVVLALPEP